MGCVVRNIASVKRSGAFPREHSFAVRKSDSYPADQRPAHRDIRDAAGGQLRLDHGPARCTREGRLKPAAWAGRACIAHRPAIGLHQHQGARDDSRELSLWIRGIRGYATRGADRTLPLHDLPEGSQCGILDRRPVAHIWLSDAVPWLAYGRDLPQLVGGQGSQRVTAASRVDEGPG